MGCAVFLMLAFIGWEYILLQPPVEDYPIIVEPIEVDVIASLSDWSIPNRPPVFEDVSSMRTLDPALLPSYERSRFRFRKRRLVFIGDVHGCYDELEELIENIGLTATDHVIFIGDMIAKGPKSGEVVDLARRLGASCVRGNHEDRTLLVRSDLKARGILDSETLNQYDLPQYPGDRELARLLTDDQAAWLNDCPVILDIGQIKNMGEVIAVHGGLIPGLPFWRQELTSVMSMRSLDLGTHVPISNAQNHIPWYRIFNQYNMVLTKGKLLPEPPYSELTTVIYGGQSFDIRQFTKGLNSKCVHGGELSALIIEDGGHSRVEHVKCKEYAKS